MPGSSLICPHCGKANWAVAPRLRAILLFLRQRKAITARDVADQFGLSIANASNQAAKLVEMSLARRGESQPNPEGGIHYTYHATEVEL